MSPKHTLPLTALLALAALLLPGMTLAATHPPPLRHRAPPQAAGREPAYQADSWLRLGGPPGGLGYDIRMRPDNPDVMYVTASPGGIFKSTDGGEWWQPVNQGIEPFPGAGAPIFTVTINPHAPDEVWVGTQFTGQVYRSEDGGQTWTESDEGVRMTAAENSIRGITFDPNDANVVYMAMERGVQGTEGTRGEVYKSTDGGETWVNLREGMDYRDVLSLGISADGSVLYAGTDGRGVYRLGTP